MLKKYPVTSRFVVLILLPISVLIALYLNHLAKGTLDYQGAIDVRGLNQAVQIDFTAQGVPTVSAKSDADAYFAQGYLHGAERMWQMVIQRRLAQGRLSEIFGQGAVSSDIWMRTLNITAAADSAYQHLDPQTKAALDAYSAGVNARWQQADAQAPELKVFNLIPQPWQGRDSIAQQKLFALNLGLNMYEEINRLAALKQMDADKLAVFYPYDKPYELLQQLNENNTSITKLGEADSVEPAQNLFNDWQSLAQTFEHQWAVGGQHVGSNGWVVSGKYSASGQPILANDPHLGITQPSVWYAMGLKGDKLDVSGMSLVGLPGIILGANRHIAWGATSLMADQQDLFVVDVPLGKPDVYLTAQGPLPITTRQEVIHIAPERPAFMHKPFKPVEVTIREVAQGPIISDVIKRSEQTLALRWSALDKTDESLSAFIKLQYAQNWQQFRQSTAYLKNPGLNFLYADVEGNIGSQLAGMFPKRGFGTGILPNLARLNEHQWQGYQDFQQLPSLFNPDEGFVVAANNAIATDDELVISHEWAPDARKNRISELLTALIADAGVNTDKRAALTVDKVMALQTDELDVGARSFLAQVDLPSLKAKLINKAPTEIKPQVTQAIERLSHWQGEYGVESVAASIFYYWFDSFKHKVLVFDDPDSLRLQQALLSRVFEMQMVQLLKDERNPWCATNASDTASAPCQQQLIESFYQAIEGLIQDTRSESVDDWQWGQLHIVEYRHKPFGDVKLLDTIFKASAPVGGSANTINAANAVANKDDMWVQTFGTAFRFGFDMQPLDESGKRPHGFALPTGQSGNVFSRYFSDNLEGFNRGEHFRFDAAVQSTLNLMPLSVGQNQLQQED